MAVQKRRHLAKAMTWRTLGTIDTFLLAWFLTGSPEFGLTFSAVELLTKTFLYYAHERMWYKFKWGVSLNEVKSTNETGHTR
jgi:uncharacterized membrane protein